MDKGLKRSFIVGSEWLYYKIYTGHKTSDLVLTEIIKPIINQFIEEDIIDKWFFIRYADPKHHLRIRFHFRNKDYIGPVISMLHEPLNVFVQEDLIWKIQLDTYQRELERYGPGTMELSETLFCYDSDTTIQFLDLIEGDEGEQLRWLFGLRSIDGLLNSFQYSLDKKLVLMDHLKTGFGLEFGISRPLKKQLDNKYREKRVEIEDFMTFTKETEPDYEPILNILESRELILKPLSEQILNLQSEGKLQLELNNLISSYIHMLMNRLFKSKNRLNEMVCYNFLYRHYRSALALNKKK
ncbi:MAG: hypothetical protein Mars2KO_01440 [Maribacter sp.]